MSEEAKSEAPMLDPEVARRVAVFRAQLKPGKPSPVLHLPDAPRGDPQRSCVSCGDAISGGFRCALCAEAARHALALGWLPTEPSPSG